MYPTTSCVPEELSGEEEGVILPHHPTAGCRADENHTALRVLGLKDAKRLVMTLD
jgi:hypothetical protein